MATADGFSRATGQLSVCNLHCAPGLGNAMGAIYNAKFAKSPVIVVYLRKVHDMTMPTTGVVEHFDVVRYAV